MKTSAMRIHALAASLGLSKARVVGHDIGLMVAYAYAAQFPEDTEKLVLMDAFLPGVEGWQGVYNDPDIWHFRFYGPTPEALVQSRERTYFDRLRGRQGALHSRARQESLRRGVRTPWPHARRMGLFPVVRGDGHGLRRVLQDQARDAGPGDRG